MNDKGTPKLYSKTLATIRVDILNVNDCPPVFEEKDMKVTLYIPTYEGIQLIQIKATDMDKDSVNKIRYDIVDGNINDSFQIDNATGIITTR